MSRSCRAGLTECHKDAQRLFQKWMINGTTIPKDFEKEVLFYGVYRGGEKEWKFVFDRYLKQNDYKLLEALCATRDPRLIDKMLRHSFNTEIESYLHWIHIFGFISELNEHSKWHTMHFLIENWNPLRKRFKGYFMHGVMFGFLKSFRLENEVRRLERLFKKRGMLVRSGKDDYLSQRIESRLKDIRKSTNWLKKNEDSVEWLETKSNSLKTIVPNWKDAV